MFNTQKLSDYLVAAKANSLEVCPSTHAWRQGYTLGHMMTDAFGGPAAYGIDVGRIGHVMRKKKNLKDTIEAF